MNILRNKLILSYSLISVLIILILSVLLNTFINRIFEQYAIEQRNQQIDKIITQVSEQYDEETGLYNVSGLELVGNAALQNGIIMHVQSISKEIDWDIKTHKAQECQALLQHAKTNMEKQYPDFKGGYEEEKYDLKNNGEIVGFLTAGYYGPYSFDDNEIILLRTLNRVIFFLGIIFLLLSALVGAVIAKHITDPVKGAIAIANKITDKEYGIQSEVNPSTLETANLINAINQMSLALEKEEKQKKQITADVAHELRTPLSNLQSHMEAMIDGIWEPTKVRLESCHAEILRLNKIVDQLRELYLLENSSSYLMKDKFQFSELCSGVFDEFALKVESKNIKLRMEIPDESPIYADRYRIKQCLVNLISNGVRFAPINGEIVVSYIKYSGGTVITVCDNGPGIPKEDLENIFERFYRTDKSRDQRTGGMGIGLSITKAIVEAHNGKITVESLPGSGTVFSINIPD